MARATLDPHLEVLQDQVNGHEHVGVGPEEAVKYSEFDGVEVEGAHARLRRVLWMVVGSRSLLVSAATFLRFEVYRNKSRVSAGESVHLLCAPRVLALFVRMPPLDAQTCQRMHTTRAHCERQHVSTLMHKRYN